MKKKINKKSGILPPNLKTFKRGGGVCGMGYVVPPWPWYEEGG
jgi:hypothetical protein